MFSALNNFFTVLKSANDKYITDTNNLTCTCLDWKEKRHQYATDDPRRLCKHIVKKLDTNALPKSIKYFRESIEYYQSHDKGFNDFDFDKIIYLPQNDLKVFGFENIFHSIWMNVYDQEGNRYGFLIDQYTFEFIWAKQRKPIGYEEVEEYFSQPSMKLPMRLQGYEKSELIQYMKTEIPGKRNSHFSIDGDQYTPSPSGIYYSVEEYRDNSCVNYPKNDITGVIVTKDEIIIEMFHAESYRIVRDTTKLNLIEEKKLFIENVPTKFVCPEEKALRLYDRSNSLLKEMNATISVWKFNTTLQKIGMLTKVEGLNDNSWIVINGGLEYGMNLVQYNTNKTYSVIPDWYVMMDFNHNSSTFQRVTHDMMKKTDALWKKDKFNELLILVMGNINLKEEKTKKKVVTKVGGISKKQAERAEWLQFVECPHCASKNLHKKSKRDYNYGTVQRYQCIDCRKIFQELIDSKSNDEVMNKP